MAGGVGGGASDMAHWLAVPDLEAMIETAAEREASLHELQECVEAIIKTLERQVRYQGRPPMVTYHNHRGAYFNVSVHEGKYRVIYEHQVAQLEFGLERTDDLAWRICGYRCTPAEMRAARERAQRDGFTGEILPNIYFKPPHTVTDDDYE
jgi:hypothetical protein